MSVTGYYIERESGETKQFSSPNPHVDPHRDIGALTQMAARNKQQKINGTGQENVTVQRKGPRGRQKLRKD